MKRSHRYFAGFVSLLVLAGLLFVSLTERQEAQVKPPDPDAPTIVKKGVLTEKQRRHSKEFEKRTIPGVNKNLDRDVGVYIDVEPGPLPDKSNPANATEYLKALTCADVTDLVVVGSITSKQSQLTENGDFVFSDYSFEVRDVLKQRTEAGYIKGSLLTITDPGGAVRLDGRKIFVNIAREYPLKIGNEFVLFLRSLRDSGSFRLIAERGVFVILENHVKPTFYRFEETFTPTDIIEQVRTIAASCSSEKKV